MDQNIVTRKTAYVFTRRVSPSGMTKTLQQGRLAFKNWTNWKFRGRPGLQLQGGIYDFGIKPVLPGLCKFLPVLKCVCFPRFCVRRGIAYSRS